MFDDQPENFRPSCEKLDDANVCPQKVPKPIGQNVDVYDILLFLLMYSVSPNTGLVEFNLPLVEVFQSFIKPESERDLLLAKLLLLIEEANKASKNLAPEGKSG